VIAPADAPLRGHFKSVLPITNSGLLNGELESELSTIASKESKTTYKFTKLAKGLTVKAGLTGVKPEVSGETPDFPEGWASATAEYAQEYFATSVGVRSNLQKTLVDTEVSVGYDNVAVGGKVTLDTAAKTAPNDYVSTPRSTQAVAKRHRDTGACCCHGAHLVCCLLFFLVLCLYMSLSFRTLVLS